MSKKIAFLVFAMLLFCSTAFAANLIAIDLEAVGVDSAGVEYRASLPHTIVENGIGFSAEWAATVAEQRTVVSVVPVNLDDGRTEIFLNVVALDGTEILESSFFVSDSAKVEVPVKDSFVISINATAVQEMDTTLNDAVNNVVQQAENSRPKNKK